MLHILALSAISGLLLAVEIPLSVFGTDAAQPTVDGQIAVVTDGRLSLPVDTSVTVSWKTGETQVTTTIWVVTKSSVITLPAWHADTATGFAGAATLHMARDRAAQAARMAQMRRVSGDQPGSVSGSIRGSKLEYFVCVAADAADQPTYTVTAGPMLPMRQAAANGTPGGPWVRCWARCVGGTVEVEPAKP